MNTRQLIATAFAALLSAWAYALPTNLPAPARISVTINTNSVLVAQGTNLFSTNLGLARLAGIIAPTNSRANGYMPVATGDQVKWDVAPSFTQTNIPLANVTDAGTSAYSNAAAFTLYPTNTGTDGQVVSLTGDKTKFIDGGSGSGIPTLNGSGTNTTLYFDNAKFGTNHTLAGGYLILNNIIGGGLRNTISSAGASDGSQGGVIAGGMSNTINSGGSFVTAVTISGGTLNSIGSQSQGSTISGGYENTINANVATISGGINNGISGFSGGAGAVVGGGQFNTIASPFAAILGGFNNTVSGSSDYSVILGGHDNIVTGIGAMAAGSSIRATNAGAFVFSDNQAGVFGSTATNQALFRFSNGVGINTNNPGTNALKVAGNVDSTVGFSINGVPIVSASSTNLTGITNSQAADKIIVATSSTTAKWDDVPVTQAVQTLWKEADTNIHTIGWSMSRSFSYMMNEPGQMVKIRVTGNSSGAADGITVFYQLSAGTSLTRWDSPSLAVPGVCYWSLDVETFCSGDLPPSNSTAPQFETRVQFDARHDGTNFYTERSIFTSTNALATQPTRVFYVGCNATDLTMTLSKNVWRIDYYP